MSAAADRMRQHRQAMERALRERITLPEAQLLIAREHWQACARRIDARIAARSAERTPQISDRSDRWMMRD